LNDGLTEINELMNDNLNRVDQLYNKCHYYNNFKQNILLTATEKNKI